MAFKLSLNTQPFSGSALIHFYAKFRLPQNARKAFDEIIHRDEVCYGALIVGLAQNSRPLDAFSAFAEMKGCNVRSTIYTVSGALSAAGQMVALEHCRVIHGHAIVAGLDGNVVVGCTLIDGYGRVGHIVDARMVFDELLPGVNTVVWNAMMSVYAQHGDKSSVLGMYNAMQVEGLVPDRFTFLALLTAFCNAGLFLESEQWFQRMRMEYKIKPGLEHYKCLVGAMAGAGRLEEAEHIAMTMPFEPDAAVWRTLLSSCAYHGAVDKTCEMAKRLLELDPRDDSAYEIVANVLSAKGRWDEVAEMRKLMIYRRVKKKQGRSWIEVKGKVHVFLAEDRRHEKTEEIYSKLAELMEKIEKSGYVPVRDEMLLREDKREAHRYDSEKLALAFGVVAGAAPPGKALRIVKNLRICRDSHEAFKYFSRVMGREIIVRDANKCHRFLNGSCTCGGIW